MIMLNLKILNSILFYSEYKFVVVCIRNVIKLLIVKDVVV